MLAGPWLALQLAIALGAAAEPPATPQRDRAFEKAYQRLADDWFAARPPTRFTDWDPAARARLEERARELGELPPAFRERALELLMEAARDAAPKIAKKGRVELETPWGEAWAYVAGSRAGSGLLLGLHGGGEGVGDAGEAHSNWQPKGLTTFHPQAVRLDADAWNTVHGERFALTLIELAKVRLDVDPDRVFVAGFSMGGTGSWHLAGRYPDLFAGAIPAHGVLMASPRSQLTTPEEVEALQHGLLPNVRNLAMYVYTGFEDRNCRPGTFLAADARMRALANADAGGYALYRFTAHEGLAHEFPPGEPERGLEWITAHRRDAFPTTIVWEYAAEPFPERRANDPLGRASQTDFYWLRCREPVDGMRVRATRDGAAFAIDVTGHPRGAAAFEIALHPEMVAHGTEVTVTSGGRELYRGTPAPTVHALITSFDAKLDRRMAFDRHVALGG